MKMYTCFGRGTATWYTAVRGVSGGNAAPNTIEFNGGQWGDLTVEKVGDKIVMKFYGVLEFQEIAEFLASIVRPPADEIISDFKELM